MEAFIESIRQKSERERRRLAVIATVVSFAVIFLVWVPVRFGLVSGRRGNVATSAERATLTPTASPDAFNAVIVAPTQSALSGDDLFGDALREAEKQSATPTAVAAPSATPAATDLNPGDTSL